LIAPAHPFPNYLTVVSRLLTYRTQAMEEEGSLILHPTNASHKAQTPITLMVHQSLSVTRARQTNDRWHYWSWSHHRARRISHPSTYPVIPDRTTSSSYRRMEHPLKPTAAYRSSNDRLHWRTFEPGKSTKQYPVGRLSATKGL
jgi:hypothetical protein